MAPRYTSKQSAGGLRRSPSMESIASSYGLDDKKYKESNAATIIQKYIRRFLGQRKLSKSKKDETEVINRTKAATVIQKVYRGYRVKKNSVAIKDTATEDTATGDIGDIGGTVTGDTAIKDTAEIENELGVANRNKKWPQYLSREQLREEYMLLEGEEYSYDNKTKKFQKEKDKTPEEDIDKKTFLFLSICGYADNEVISRDPDSGKEILDENGQQKKGHRTGSKDHPYDLIELDIHGVPVAIYDRTKFGYEQLQEDVAKAMRRASELPDGDVSEETIIVKFQGDVFTPPLKPGDPPILIPNDKYCLIHRQGNEIHHTFAKFREGGLETFLTSQRNEYDASEKAMRSAALTELKDMKDITERDKIVEAKIRSALRTRFGKEISAEIEKSKAEVKEFEFEFKDSLDKLKGAMGDKAKSVKSKQAFEAFAGIGVPHAVKGVTFLKVNGDPHKVKVMFRGSDAFRAAYVAVPGTRFNVRVQVADSEGNAIYYDNGKEKPFHGEPGQIVYDKDTLLWKDADGNYQHYGTDKRRKGENMIRDATFISSPGFPVITKGTAQNAINSMKEMSIQAFSIDDARGIFIGMKTPDAEVVINLSKTVGKGIVFGEMPEIPEKKEGLFLEALEGKNMVRLPFSTEEYKRRFKFLEEDGDIEKLNKVRLKIVRRTDKDGNETAEIDKDYVYIEGGGGKYSRKVRIDDYFSQGFLGRNVFNAEAKLKEFCDEIRMIRIVAKPSEKDDERRIKQQEFIDAAINGDIKKVKELVDEYQKRRFEIDKLLEGGSEGEVRMANRFYNFDIYGEKAEKEKDPNYSHEKNALHYVLEALNEAADEEDKANLTEVAVYLLDKGFRIKDYGKFSGTIENINGNFKDELSRRNGQEVGLPQNVKDDNYYLCFDEGNKLFLRINVNDGKFIVDEDHIYNLETQGKVSVFKEIKDEAKGQYQEALQARANSLKSSGEEEGVSCEVINEELKTFRIGISSPNTVTDARSVSKLLPQEREIVAG